MDDVHGLEVVPVARVHHVVDLLQPAQLRLVVGRGLGVKVDDYVVLVDDGVQQGESCTAAPVNNSEGKFSSLVIFNFRFQLIINAIAIETYMLETSQTM